MRLGEIHNIVNRSIDSNGQIYIANEALFGSQAYLISNYDTLIRTLSILSSQPWNELDHTVVNELRDKYGAEDRSIQVSADEFNRLSSYVASLNERIPMFISIVNSIVSDQDEKVINIKLPEEIKDLEQLNELNERFLDIFKKYNFSGEFVFKGFDKGTDWYQILITAEILYRYFAATLAIAIGVVQFRKVFWESENAKLAYEVAKKEASRGEAKYLNDLTKEKIEQDISRVVEDMGSTSAQREGKEKAELHTELVRVTTELVKELGHGTEFHLSLNPPSYIDESSEGSLRIDYSKMPKLEQAQPEQEPRQIEATNDSPDTSE